MPGLQGRVLDPVCMTGLIHGDTATQPHYSVTADVHAMLVGILRYDVPHTT
jgi:hypothetical protein